MINSRWKFALLITVVAMVFTGCHWLIKQPPVGNLSLTVSLPAGSNPAKVTATLTHVGSNAVVTGNLTISNDQAAGKFNSLAGGDWTVVVTLYDAQANEMGSASDTVKIVDKRTASLHIQIDAEPTVDWLGKPQIDQPAIRAGESTQVRVTILVNRPASELAPSNGTSPVELFVWAAGVEPFGIGTLDNDGDWTSLGYLFDNGDLTNGDEIKGDRIYSNYFDFEEDEAGTLPLRIVVTAEDGTQYFVPLEIEILETEGDTVEQILDIHDEAIDQLNAMSASMSAEDMLDELANWLESLPSVDSAIRNGDLLQINYSSGLTSFIHLHEAGDVGGGPIRGGGASSPTMIPPSVNPANAAARAAVPKIPLSEQTQGVNADVPSLFSAGFAPLNTDDENYIDSRRILVWAPFAAEFAPWDETAGIVQGFGASDLGFDVAVLQNEAANVDSLRTITDYGMVIFATHGSGGAWLATGEIASPTDKTYEIDLHYGYMAIWQEMKKKVSGGVETKQPVYAVNDGWLQVNMNGSFPNSVIVNNSCESTATDRLWNVFASAGAGAYFGYSKIVYSEFAVNQVHELVQGLADGKTTGESYTEKTDPQGSHKAVWQMRGNEDLTFAAGLLNGSFEEGLTAWHTQGDGRVIYALGHLLPTDELRMGIISTGLGFTEAQGSIQQTFRVDDDATQLSFDWNFLSEEFLEYIGSQYMDWFRVYITVDGLETDLLYKTIDDIAADFGAKYCTSRDDAAECIISGANGNLVHVSPHIVFDIGDVWMTGWQSASFDISDFQGQRVTLTFGAHDVSDSVYDTAILLDNIRLE